MRIEPVQFQPAGRALEDTTPTPSRVTPGPRGFRLLGSLFEVRRDPITFIRNSQQRFGDVVRFRMGGRQLFLLSHPEAARQVLVANHRNYVTGPGLDEARPLFGNGLLTADGQQWHTLRQRLQGAFEHRALDGFAAATVAATDRLVSRWRGTPGAVVPLAQETPRLALDVLGQTLLPGDLARHSRVLDEALSTFTRWAMARMASFLRLPLGWPGPRACRARRALSVFDHVVAELIENYTREGAGPRRAPDLLGLLLGGEPALTPRQIRDEVTTLLVAGHETTAAGLMWTAWAVARRPDLGAALREEVDRGLGSAPPTAENLERLPLMAATVDEALRLFPPVWLLPRHALSDDVVLEHLVPRGAEVLVSVFGIQRHPDFWPAAEEFRPERFLAAPGVGHPANAYLPFGWGPRACIGRSFGRLEILVALTRLMQQVELDACDPDPGFEALLTLRAAGPTRVRVRFRQRAGGVV